MSAKVCQRFLYSIYTLVCWMSWGQFQTMTSKKLSLIIIELYRRIIAEYVGVMGPIVTLSTENLENKIR